MTLRGVLDVVLSDPGMARVVAAAGSAELAVTAPPPVQPLVAAALAARRPGAGVPVLLEIDMNGARQVRAAMPHAQLVFLAPPSFDELARRLVGRGTEDAAKVRGRLDRARIELAAEDEFDAVVVNEDLERASDALVALMGISSP